ncbi:autotransporter outer membrane beta-barrel domain-containing protein [Pseudomonas syringae]|nr:autotransporter outer membrane beta-barrel domain-containing protein [Pseudomonas syringae]
MKTLCNNIETVRLTSCIAVTLLMANSAGAVTLNPGDSAGVDPGSQPASWKLVSAALTVNPGGQTLGIITEEASTLTINQGVIRGSPASPETPLGIWLRGSTATIADSTITSSSDAGLSVTEDRVASTPSTATVTNSSITGKSRGVNVSSGSELTLVGSQVSGSGAGAAGLGILGDGVGMAVVGATANVQDSSITGSNRGIVVSASGRGQAPSVVTLDNTSVTGTAGSALLVNAVTPSFQPNATFVVQNGSTLTGGNGVMLEVGLAGTANPSTVNFTADNSTLTGDVLVTAPSTANITLRNNASTTGNMTNIASLNMDSSTMTGNVVEQPGSTTPVSMVNNSTLTGQLLDVSSLDMNSSTLTGGVTSASGSTTRVTLANNSTLTGQLTNIGALNIDQSLMTGDVIQDAATPAAITLSNSGTLTGSVSNAQSMNLDATSRWNMINDSSVGSLTLNGGTVNLRGANAGFRTLTLGSLSGAGTFALGTDLAGHLSDLINVTGSATGSHTLAVQNTGVDPVEESHAQQVVHTGSGDGVFAVPDGVVDVGTFQYRLEKRGTDWFLVQATTTGPDPTDPADPINPGEPIITPSTRAVIGLFSAAPTVWYGELSTLRSRMGELRNGHEQGGFWTRAYGNKFSVSTTDQVNYQQNQQGVSFGIDTPLPSAEGQWLLGMMGGYSRSDLDLQRGTSGEVNSYYLGVYSTWLSTSGYYIDAVIKANRFENKADVLMSDNVKSEGGYRSYGFGGSIEAGKHINLADNWFIEPYAQVSTLWVSGEHYDLDNGMQARSNHADSLLGKVGTHVGRTYPLAKGGFVQPYVKIAAVQEFLRSNKVKVNSTTFSDDLSGSRGEIGAGLAAQLTDVLQVHADVDYSNGENIEQPWGVNVGLRYSW